MRFNGPFAAKKLEFSTAQVKGCCAMSRLSDGHQRNRGGHRAGGMGHSGGRNKTVERPCTWEIHAAVVLGAIPWDHVRHQRALDATTSEWP
mmetsp:Transcript_106112/g.179211  ORF Transcript_106112/g.179211 Transcript_106112/m.179211 type:complete len:91 (+) Transcript_106112:188-460(+)